MRLNKKLKYYILLTVIVLTTVTAFRFFYKDNLIQFKTYSKVIKDRNNQIMRITLSGDEKYRINYNLNEVDPKLVNAFLDKEDKYFYSHAGFNPISLTRAIYKSYIVKSSRQGASTITMQVSRLMYPHSTKSVLGKLIQLLNSIELEILYSKKEILQAYLNWTPFGSNIEGIGAACFIYFEKSCQKLTSNEISYLVNIPQNPQKYLTQALARKKNIPYLAPHFTDMILSQANIIDDPQMQSVRTTLDLRMQGDIENLAHKYFAHVQNYGVKNFSVVIVDTRDNEILSYIGSANYFNKDIKGQIDANRSLKPPGSTLKPFIYALALQQGLIHEKSLLKDTKMSFSGINPENFDEQFMGPVPSDQALVLSRNLPAVDLASKLNSPTLYDFLKNKSSLKFRDEKHYGLSLALGGVEFTMLDLIKLYSSLANLGHYKDINYFLDLQKKNNKNINSNKIVSSESAYIVLQMLKKNPRFEGSTIQDLIQQKIPVAWKTGTSKSYKDAWTIGLVGHLLIGIWFGDNDREMNPSLVGRSMSAPLFFQIFDYIKNNSKIAVQQENPYWNSRLGLNIKSVHICTVSKKIATENCQHKTDTALFISSVSPIEKCQIHRKLLFNITSQKFECPKSDNSNGHKIEKIIEVWPDDLMSIFQQVGLAKNALSNQIVRCDRSSLATQEVLLKDLVITSPQNSIDYILQVGPKGVRDLKVELNALSESDSSYLDWFVNKEYVGRSNKLEPLFYYVKNPGYYNIYVKDNLGRSQSSHFSVKVISQ